MTKTLATKFIKQFDVFYKLNTTEFGQSKHYYVCIYSQSLDENNKLVNDVYGLMVTTNQKYFDLPNDYNVKTEINGTPCFVLCDKWFRLKIEDTMEVKEKKFSRYEISEITEKLNKFITEMKRQIGEINK